MHKMNSNFIEIFSTKGREVLEIEFKQQILMQQLMMSVEFWNYREKELQK